ncbi:MAG: type II secretion system protein N [Pseudomonadota bacterium]
MFEQVLNRSVEPLRWLLVALIAYSLATTIWFFFASPTETAQRVSAGNNSSAERASRPKANVNWILSKHLFGEAGAAPVVAQSDEPVEQTRLPLELRMVTVADVAEESAAIVAQKGKPGLLYNVGETLPGNAKLEEVYRDHIILRRAGNREKLGFPKTKGSFVARNQTPAPPARVNRRNAAVRTSTRADAELIEEDDDQPSAEDAVAEYQQRLNEDAEGALDELGIETVDSGGYRIGSTNNPYLSQTGLQAGDVILSVNGRPVGDIQQDQLEIANIMAQGSARIEVQRGARRFFITASLPRN